MRRSAGSAGPAAISASEASTSLAGESSGLPVSGFGPPASILLRFRGATGPIVMIRVRPTMRFRRMIPAYLGAVRRLDYSAATQVAANVRLVCEGRPLSEDDTPESVGLDDGDTVDVSGVVREQVTLRHATAAGSHRHGAGDGGTHGSAASGSHSAASGSHAGAASGSHVGAASGSHAGAASASHASAVSGSHGQHQTEVDISNAPSVVAADHPMNRVGGAAAASVSGPTAAQPPLAARSSDPANDRSDAVDAPAVQSVPVSAERAPAAPAVFSSAERASVAPAASASAQRALASSRSAARDADSKEEDSDLDSEADSEAERASPRMSRVQREQCRSSSDEAIDSGSSAGRPPLSLSILGPDGERLTRPLRVNVGDGFESIARRVARRLGRWPEEIQLWHYGRLVSDEDTWLHLRIWNGDTIAAMLRPSVASGSAADSRPSMASAAPASAAPAAPVAAAGAAGAGSRTAAGTAGLAASAVAAPAAGAGPATGAPAARTGTGIEDAAAE